MLENIKFLAPHLSETTNFLLRSLRSEHIIKTKTICRLMNCRLNIKIGKYTPLHIQRYALSENTTLNRNIHEL